MNIKAQVLDEDCRVSDGVEYVSVTCMEIGDKPLLQMFDYGLANDERTEFKGKLKGKVVNLQIKTIRQVFSGRPQMIGKLELVK